MRRNLERWLWEGSFEPAAMKLDVLSPEDLPQDDLLTLSRKTIQDYSRQIEDLQQALHRRRVSSQPTTARGEEDKEVRKIAKSLLPVLDALDRIIDYGRELDRQDEEFENWLRSVEALRTRMTKVAEEIGLRPISAVGMEVDLEKHDVVGVVPAGEYPPNTVVDERQTGYYFRGRLLRDAKVIVAQ